jgi:hypothetical protein
MSVLSCYLILVNEVVDKMVRTSVAARQAPCCFLTDSQLQLPPEQVLASLLVSVVLVGVKLTAARELVHIVERRKELKGNLALLQGKLEGDDLADFLDDIAFDTAQRQETIDELSSEQVLTAAEGVAIDKGEAVFTQYGNSSAPVTQLKLSQTIARSETKLDEAGRFLLGRAEVEVWASPQELVAYALNYDGRHIQSDFNPAVDACMPRIVAKVNNHHVIVFSRKKIGFSLSDRTFLLSVIAKKVAENPLTYILVAVPIPQHPKITPKDEAGAVRAESFRSFRFTEVGPGRSKMEVKRPLLASFLASSDSPDSSVCSASAAYAYAVRVLA